MNGVRTMDSATAARWIELWDRQQEAGMPDREERFTALIDAVEAGTGRGDPLVLDIGCGPGSLGARLMERLPEARVVGIDADPVTLALGRAAHGDAMTFVTADLRGPGWLTALGLDRQPDAAVSTTALHWLPEHALRDMYAELAAMLRPGGLFLNGDHLREDEAQAPALARLGRALPELEDRRRFPDGHGESWEGWWEAVAADESLAPLAAERTRLRFDAHHGSSRSALLRTHVDALRAAGFAEVGTLWQRGDSRLLAAVR
jgi:SAM-dependent methyltransferase